MSKQTNLQVSRLFEMRQRERCGELFSTWRTTVIESRAQKESHRIATTFFYKNLLTKTLSTWRDYVTYKKHKRQQDEEKCCAFRKTQARLVWAVYFQKWQIKLNELLEDERKNELACGFREKNLKMTMYTSWRAHIRACQLKILQQKQANAFLEMRLKAQFFIRWREQQQEALMMKDQNASALLLWSTNVLKKCLSAWIDWYRAKKVR